MNEFVRLVILNGSEYFLGVLVGYNLMSLVVRYFDSGSKSRNLAVISENNQLGEKWAPVGIPIGLIAVVMINFMATGSLILK